MIGFVVACIAMFIDFFVSLISNAKYSVIERMIDDCGES